MEFPLSFSLWPLEGAIYHKKDLNQMLPAVVTAGEQASANAHF